MPKTGTKLGFCSLRLWALSIAALGCAPAVAEPPKFLDLSLRIHDSEIQSARDCEVPSVWCTFAAGPESTLATPGDTRRFTSGLELGAIGPVRLKFTGTRIKLRILF